VHFRSPDLAQNGPAPFKAPKTKTSQSALTTALTRGVPAGKKYHVLPLIHAQNASTSALTFRNIGRSWGPFGNSRRESTDIHQITIHDISFNTLSYPRRTRICLSPRPRSRTERHPIGVVTVYIYKYSFRNNGKDGTVFRCVSMACQSSTGEGARRGLRDLLSAL